MATDFSGYDINGLPMYRHTADGPQCAQCDGMNGDHLADDCPNRDEA